MCQIASRFLLQRLKGCQAMHEFGRCSTSFLSGQAKDLSAPLISGEVSKTAQMKNLEKFYIRQDVSGQIKCAHLL
jgi:hypothetical protein